MANGNFTYIPNGQDIDANKQLYLKLEASSGYAFNATSAPSNSDPTFTVFGDIKIKQEPIVPPYLYPEQNSILKILSIPSLALNPLGLPKSLVTVEGDLQSTGLLHIKGDIQATNKIIVGPDTNPTLRVDSEITANAPLNALQKFTANSGASITGIVDIASADARDSSRLLTVTNGLITQVNDTEKYISIGSIGDWSGFTKRYQESFDKNDYGVSIHSGTDFLMLHIVERNSGDKTDSVLAWGDDQNDFFRIRFVGKHSKRADGSNRKPANIRKGEQSKGFNEIKAEERTWTYQRDIITVRPSGAVFVDGSLHSYNYHKFSDIRLKDSVEPIASALDKALALSGISYTWKIDDDADGPSHLSKERQFGFIAQEVESLYPGLISDDAFGRKSIDYTQIIPILLESIREQQFIIDTQKTRLDRLEVALRNLGVLP